MFANAHQKILEAIKQWFENARFPTGPALIPLRVRIDGSEHHLPMSIREYRATFLAEKNSP